MSSRKGFARLDLIFEHVYKNAIKGPPTGLSKSYSLGFHKLFWLN